MPGMGYLYYDPQYWLRYMQSRRSSFECYGDHASLALVLENYLNKADDILQIGCGNSRLASELYDVGYRRILSIDTNATVINEQASRNRERASLKFEVKSATETGLDDEAMNVVLDKGTLDALLPPDDEGAVQLVEKMFKEVTRVLSSSGRYIIVTLAQEHIVRAWIGHFLPTNHFILRIHKIDNTASGFPMPVFILVATKMGMPMAMPMEFFRAGKDQPVLLRDAGVLYRMLLMDRCLNNFVHKCTKYSPIVREDAITLYSSESRRLCELYVVDEDVKDAKSYSVFIVPIGSRFEWLFATEKGRRSLRLQCQKDRLVIVFFCDDNSFDVVKDELTAFTKRLNPVKDAQGVPIPYDFVSLGENDVKKTMVQGESEDGRLSAEDGRLSAEDVVIGDADSPSAETEIRLNFECIPYSKEYTRMELAPGGRRPRPVPLTGRGFRDLLERYKNEDDLEGAIWLVEMNHILLPLVTDLSCVDLGEYIRSMYTVYTDTSGRVQAVLHTRIPSMLMKLSTVPNFLTSCLFMDKEEVRLVELMSHIDAAMYQRIVDKYPASSSLGEL